MGLRAEVRPKRPRARRRSFFSVHSCPGRPCSTGSGSYGGLVLGGGGPTGGDHDHHDVRPGVGPEGHPAGVADVPLARVASAQVVEPVGEFRELLAEGVYIEPQPARIVLVE
jgi:hypothetical protein